MWDRYKIVYKYIDFYQDVEVPLGLGDVLNPSVYMVVTLGGYTIGFNLRFKTYSKCNGEYKVEERRDVLLTGEDWQNINEFVYETINSEPRRGQSSSC